MEAIPTPIIKYFSGFHQYLVPLFQRPYTWTERQWKTLWEDIELFIGAEPGSRSTHFMGAIVTMPARSVPIGVSKYTVIDGQQRLTTIAVLLAAIRDELLVQDAAQRRRVQHHYLTNDGYEGLEFPKVLPTQGDRPFYLPLIDPGASIPESQFQRAYDFFRKKLRAIDLTTAGDGARQVLEILEKRLMVVMINLGDEDDPYLIFESLNFKGSPLEQADLVRNYVLMRFPLNEQQGVYDGLWLPMQQRLGSSLTEFMRHFLGSQGEEVRKGDVYASIKRSIASFDSAGIRGLMTRMERLSSLYSRIAMLERDPNEDLVRYFRRFARLDFGTVYPLLLGLYEDFQKQLFTQTQFVEALRVLDSFIVRRMVTNVPSNSLSGLFIGLSKLRPGTNSPADWLAVTLAKEDRNRRWPSDSEFRSSWETRGIYGSRVCPVILQCLEEQFGHREPVSLDDSTVEHVLPQTLTPEWRGMLGEGHERIHAEWVHTIGNLTLTGYNPELSNKSYLHKKSIYAASHFELNRHFAECEEWTEEEIRKRGQALFHFALKLWPKPIASPDDSSKNAVPRADFHPACIALAKEHLKVNLVKRTTRRYENNDKGVRLFCAVSTEHNETSETPYFWFGFPPLEQKLLDSASCPWICLGCGSADVTFLIPARLILDLLPQMSVSTGGADHSHLVVHLKNKRYTLKLLRGVDGLELNQFRLVNR